MVSSVVVVVSSSTSQVAVTHALKSATVCLTSGGEKLGALEIGLLDGAITVQLLSSGNRELSDGAGSAEKERREWSYVRDYTSQKP